MMNLLRICVYTGESFVKTTDGYSGQIIIPYSAINQSIPMLGDPRLPRMYSYRQIVTVVVEYFRLT